MSIIKMVFGIFKNNLEVKFTHITEVGMGSPFNRANLELKGRWIPNLPKEEWQDLTATSKDGRCVGLVCWNHGENNQPRFSIYSIDLKKQAFSKSEVVDGCCKKIWWNEAANQFDYDRFLYIKKAPN